MALDLNKKNIKRIMLLIAFAALLYWGLNNLKWISGVLGSLLDLLSPLLIGICIAFVLILMRVALERLWDRGLIKWNSPWNAKLKRPVCLTLTLLLFLGIIFAIFFILIPRLEEAGTTMVANIPTYVNQIQVWWTTLSAIAAAPVSQTSFKIVLPVSCICASVGAVSVSAAVCTGDCVLSVCGARRVSGAVSRCTAAGTSGTAFITLTGLLTSETGSRSRSAASSQSVYCRRGLSFPRRKNRSAVSARIRTVDEMRISSMVPLPYSSRPAALSRMA